MKTMNLKGRINTGNCTSGCKGYYANGHFRLNATNSNSEMLWTSKLFSEHPLHSNQQQPKQVTIFVTKPQYQRTTISNTRTKSHERYVMHI